MRPSSAGVARVLALAALYFVFARLGLLMDAVHGFATLVWPASGLALAAVALRPDIWPGVTLGAFAVNVWIGAPWPAAAGIALGNTLEAVLGAYALRPIAGTPRRIERIHDVFRLVVPAAMLSTIASAAIGVASLAAAGVVPRAAALETARAWWLGDAIGDVVVGSLLLTWNAPIRLPVPPRRILEGLALVGAVLGLGTRVFLGPASLSRADLFLGSYALSPLLVWASVRFGLRGATMTVFLASVVAITCTALGTGPFVRETLARSLLHLQVFMALISTTGLVLGAAITERARAVSSRDEVLAIVSHDLRSPLGAIRVSAEAADRLLARGSLESAAKQLAVAHRAVARMEGLVNDLVDLAAIDAGHLSLQLSAEPACALVREASETLQTLAARHELTLDEETATSEDVIVECDRRRVLQVFSNLIGNAVKFATKRAKVSVGFVPHAAEVEFFVCDTGPGIDPGDLPFIFERYRRGSRAHHPGAGLGLFIAKTIVEAQGGRIHAQSAAGVGTRVSFTLPRTRREHAAPDATFASATAPAPR